MLLIPILNTEFIQIDQENTFVVEIENITYDYKQNSIFKELKSSKSCTIYNNCNFIINNIVSLEEIDDESIIVKNAKNLKLHQNCDNRNIVLNGNSLIQSVNCEIKLLAETFSNEKIEYYDRFYYPTKLLNQTYKNTINFDYLSIKNFKN